jgi:hypothetical protein
MAYEPATPMAIRIMKLGRALNEAAFLSEIIFVGFMIVYAMTGIVSGTGRENPGTGRTALQPVIHGIHPGTRCSSAFGSKNLPHGCPENSPVNFRIHHPRSKT